MTAVDVAQAELAAARQALAAHRAELRPLLERRLDLVRQLRQLPRRAALASERAALMVELGQVTREVKAQARVTFRLSAAVRRAEGRRAAVVAARPEPPAVHFFERGDEPRFLELQARRARAQRDKQ